jgi:hypothetical protein
VDLSPLLLTEFLNKDNAMPSVGKKKFPYTEKGEKEAKEYGKKKGIPVTVMVAIGKPKSLPTRGGRTATNMMKKSSRGK